MTMTLVSYNTHSLPSTTCVFAHINLTGLCSCRETPLINAVTISLRGEKVRPGASFRSWAPSETMLLK